MHRVAIATDAITYQDRYNSVFRYLGEKGLATACEPVQLYDSNVLVTTPPFTDATYELLREAKRKNIRRVIDFPSTLASETNTDNQIFGTILSQADAIWADSESGLVSARAASKLLVCLPPAYEIPPDRIYQSQLENRVVVGCAPLQRYEYAHGFLSALWGRLADEYGNISFVIIGRLPHVERRPGPFNLHHFKNVNWDKLASAIGYYSLDLALLPRLGHPAIELRLLQYYTASGVPTILSSASQMRAVSPSIAAFAGDLEDWFNTACRLLEDESERKEIVTNAQSWMESNYGIESVSNKWLEALGMLNADPGVPTLLLRPSSPAPKTQAVDVIIPIHNAFEDVTRCIEAVAQHTDLKKHHLVLIDDGSSDARVLPYLQQVAGFFEQEGKNVVLITHDLSLGFVKSANEGMKAGSGDVIILNSDTIVGPSWLDKLETCAYSKKDVGFVSPLSNNATILSLPWAGTNVEEINKYLEEAAFPYVELPTCIGFCMYVKRSVLDEYGYFDESFGTGYGEENDLTQRAREKFGCLADTQNFVFHKGKASFSGLDQRAMANEASLNRRHPMYMFYVQSWNCVAPLMPLKGFVKKRLSDKPTAVQVLHNYRAPGGTELFTEQLVNSLSDDYEPLVVYPHAIGIAITDDKCYEEIIPVASLSPHVFAERDDAIEGAFSRMLKAFSPYVVHFQHILNLPTSLVTIAKETGTKVFISLHDTYALCQDPHVLDRPSTGIDYCIDIEKCLDSGCLGRKFGGRISEEEHINRRIAVTKMLNVADAVIVPSPFNATVVEPFGVEAIVIQHGLQNLPSFIPRKGPVRRIGFIGSVSKRKGTNLLIEAFAKLGRSDLELHLFGGVGGISDRVRSMPRPTNLVFHGPYKASDLPRITQEIDLGVVPSIFPESYCYTLDELSAAGIPTIVSSCGALPERVLPEMVFEPNVHSLMRKLNEVCDNEELRVRAVKHTRSRIKDAREQLAEYTALYNRRTDSFPKVNQEKASYMMDRLTKLRASYRQRSSESKKIAPRLSPPTVLQTSSFSSQSSAQKNLGKVGRNQPCPCGSGKKYKKCHGDGLV